MASLGHWNCSKVLLLFFDLIFELKVPALNNDPQPLVSIVIELALLQRKFKPMLVRTFDYNEVMVYSCIDCKSHQRT